MEFKDYYQTMGLDRTASPEAIKQAYRRLARKYHPDVSKEPNAETLFKELGEAYDVLKDPEKRAQYDKFGQYWREQGQRPPQGEGGPSGYQYQGAGGQDFDPAEFEDFLSSIFNQRQRSHPFHEQGQDIHARLAIFLEDSYHGSEKLLQLQMPVMGARGQVGYEQKSIKVKIPQGVVDKQQIRLKGQGGKGPTGKAGDLYIEIAIAPHPFFQLDNKDVHLVLPVSPWEAALGGSIPVPTLGGKVNLKIPKNSQAGKQLRLKGRGLPGHPAGDQLVTLQIVIPEEENTEASRLYAELGQQFQFNPRKALGV